MDYYRLMKKPECQRTNCRIIVNTCTHKLHVILDGRWYRSYPIGVGKILDKVRPHTYEIISMQYNPGGRFGARWIGLNKKHYAIHGTDDPFSIGRSVTHGSIRMHNKDVVELFEMVDLGTRVRIV